MDKQPEHAFEYRPKFHVTPPQGRLNDPNGVILVGDKLHVFYQKDPSFPKLPKRTGWGHVSTNWAQQWDGIWQHHPDALLPDSSYDAQGCYSGGAIADSQGNIALFYTGNVKKLDPITGRSIREATQNRVQVSDISGSLGGMYYKDPNNPVIVAPEVGFTAHYRDPMVTVDPDAEMPGNRKYRMVLGAQRADETGAVVLYQSDDLDSWDFAGELSFDLSEAQPGTSPDIIPAGYMWECPNLFSIRDSSTGERYEVLIICPQGLIPQIDPETGITHYASSDQCGYVVGHLENTVFHVERGFSELDYGHQFYAPQVTSAQPGNLVSEHYIMLGWMGLPAADDTPSLAAEGWVHNLTLPRILSLRDGVLRQELVFPQGEELPSGQVLFERFQLGSVDKIIVISDTQENPVVTIAYSADNGGKIAVSYAGDTRVAPCPPGECVVSVDGAAIEITAGDGVVAFALVAYPRNGNNWAAIALKDSQKSS